MGGSGERCQHERKGVKTLCNLNPALNPAGIVETENWALKIAKAKEAREAGRKLRKGKPKVFRADGREWRGMPE